MTADDDSRRRAIASLSTAQRLRLEALFVAKPDAKVAIYSLRETAARTHTVTAAEVRKAADREAQETRERFWASLDKRPTSLVMAPVGYGMTVPVERQAPGTAPWPPEFVYDDIVPSAPAPTWRDLQLGAVPDLSPCTMPPRPAVTITIER